MNIEEKDPLAALTDGLDVFNHVHISENDRGTPGIPPSARARVNQAERWEKQAAERVAANKLDEELFKTISKDLETRNSEQLKLIRQQMFVFDDLEKFEA